MATNYNYKVRKKDDINRVIGREVPIEPFCLLVMAIVCMCFDEDVFESLAALKAYELIGGLVIRASLRC